MLYIKHAKQLVLCQLVACMLPLPRPVMPHACYTSSGISFQMPYCPEPDPMSV